MLNPQTTARPQEISGFSVLKHSPGKQMMSMTPMSPIVGQQRSGSCPASPMTRPASPMTHDARPYARPKNLTAVNPASPMLLPISPMTHNAQSKSRAGVNPKAGIHTSSPMDKLLPSSPSVMKLSAYNPKECSRVYGFGMRISERAPYIVEMSNALIDEHDRPLSGLVSRGDELMAVDNVVVSSMTLPQVKERMTGPFGSIAELTFRTSTLLSPTVSPKALREAGAHHLPPPRVYTVRAKRHASLPHLGQTRGAIRNAISWSSERGERNASVGGVNASRATTAIDSVMTPRTGSMADLQRLTAQLEKDTTPMRAGQPSDTLEILEKVVGRRIWSNMAEYAQESSLEGGRQGGREGSKEPFLHPPSSQQTNAGRFFTAVAADDTEDFDEVAKSQIPSQIPGCQVEYPSHISQSYLTSETNNSLGLSFTPLPSPHSLRRRSSSSSSRGADSLEGAFGLLLSSPGQRESMMPQRAESDGAGEPGGDDECLVSPFLGTSAPLAPPPSFDTSAAWRGEESERASARAREREKGSFAVRPRSSTRAAPSATRAAPSALSASHRTTEMPETIEVERSENGAEMAGINGEKFQEKSLSMYNSISKWEKGFQEKSFSSNNSISKPYSLSSSMEGDEKLLKTSSRLDIKGQLYRSIHDVMMLSRTMGDLHFHSMVNRMEQHVRQLEESFNESEAESKVVIQTLTSQLNEVRAERDGYRAHFLSLSGVVEPSSTRSGQEAEHLCASFVLAHGSELYTENPVPLTASPLRTRLDMGSGPILELEQKLLDEEKERVAQEAVTALLQADLARARQDVADLSTDKIALEREYTEILKREILFQERESTMRHSHQEDLHRLDGKIVTLQQQFQEELQTELAGARQEIADLSAAKVALEREYEEVLAREPLPHEVRVELVLAMDSRNISGAEEEFKTAVARDVAAAVGGDASKVRIIRLEPGSIRVHMVLDPDICGGGEAPADVANLLAQQAADPQSPLKQGRYTCATTGAFVTVVDFRQLHEEAALESSLLLETIKELQTELAGARQEIADLSAAKIVLEREYEEVLARESLSQRSSSQQQEQLKRLHQLIQQQQEKRQDELHLMQEQSSLLLNQMQEQSSQMQLSAQEVDRLKNASAKDAQHLEQLKKQVAELTQTCAAYEKETKELTQMCAAYEKETKMLKFYMSTLPIHSKNN